MHKDTQTHTHAHASGSRYISNDLLILDVHVSTLRGSHGNTRQWGGGTKINFIIRRQNLDSTGRERERGMEREREKEGGRERERGREGERERERERERGRERGMERERERGW